MKNQIAVFLLVVIGFFTYFPTLFNGFVGDDFLQIVNNTQVHSLANIPHFFTGSTYESGGADRIAGIFYRPLMMSCFALLYSVFGVNPLPYHLLQVVLHIANAVLLFFFLRFFLKKNIYALLVALVFMLHPINNEAVVYSANLQETLFFFFGMLSLLIIQSKSANYINTVLLGICLLSALLSKESGVLFLILGSIYAFLFQKNKRWVTIFLGLAVFVLYLFLRYGVAKMYLSQGSIAPIYQAPLLIRLLNIPEIIYYYLKTFLFPFSLGIDQFWIVRSVSYTDFYFPLFCCLLVFFLIFFGGIYFYRQQKNKFIYYVFFSLWFLCGLAMHLQILPLDATVADRWFYFPIVGLLGILGLFVSLLQVNFSFLFRFIRMLLLCMVLLFMAVSFLRCFNWRDELTLYSHDVHTTRKNFVFDNGYATALINNGEFESAKPYVVSSLKEYPYYANLNNMAIVYVSEKRYALAKKDLLAATKVGRNYLVYENYSSFLLVYDDLTEAYQFTKSALLLFPNNAKLWLNMAKIAYLRDDQALALAAVQKSYQLQTTPESSFIYSNLKQGKPITVKHY